MNTALELVGLAWELVNLGNLKLNSLYQTGLMDKSTYQI